MSKPFAKIVVFTVFESPDGWRAVLETDMDSIPLVSPGSRKATLSLARMWSRRLGNISVECEKK